MRYIADKKLCIAQSQAVVKHISEKYNLVIPEKGSLAVDIVEADFGKFELLANQIKE